MSDIKTRDIVKGTIKAIDKAAIAGERVKAAYVRTRDKAAHGAHSAEDSPNEYADDRFSGSMEAAAYEAVSQCDRQGRKAVKTTKDNISIARERMERRKAGQPKRAAQKKAEQKAGGSLASPSQAPAPVGSANPGQPPRRTGYAKPAAIKTTDQGRKGIKQTARRPGHAMVKTASEPVNAARRTVKTADRAARTTAKTTPATAKAARKSAQAAAKASYRAAQAAKASAKAAAAGVKAAAKATVSAVKAIIAATKALITAILAGGWIAVAVIIIICLIGLIAGSCFGIFFSGEDSGAGQSMQTVVREINEDYEARLDAIQANISYDVLEMSGSRAVWPEVLAVYSVKTTTDPDNAREVATMDDSKKAILKDIFWQMNEISSRTETQTDAVIEEAGDGTGSIAETTTTVTRTTLYITVSHKTAEEMADHFHFNEEQREQLAALLADENRSMWNQLLYGIGDGDGEIVTVALSQLGNVGGEPYWSWYGFGSRVEWCACFVSWCANQCGHIESGVLPKFAGVGTGEEWFKARGLWRDNQYTPNPGDIIFFDWETDGLDGKPDHVGIVEKVEGGVIYTIEGNFGDVCLQNHYSLGYYEILGFGVLQTGLH